jgi:hypothetical protein
MFVILESIPFKRITWFRDHVAPNDVVMMMIGYESDDDKLAIRGYLIPVGCFVFNSSFR